MSHVHREGWLSGVYYADVSQAVRGDDPEHGGWLELGRAPEELRPQGSRAEAPLLLPEEGCFALFPSFYWHRTRPFGGGNADAQRVAVAFDVVPAG